LQIQHQEHIGGGNDSCSPMAEPTTSAKSQAAMASSQRIQRNQTVGVE
jgi:hypothetical protein